MLHRHSRVEGDPATGVTTSRTETHVALFPMPSRIPGTKEDGNSIMACHYLTLEDAPKCDNMLTRKTILWKIDYIPDLSIPVPSQEKPVTCTDRRRPGWLCSEMVHGPGYLVALQCQSSIRLTWSRLVVARPWNRTIINSKQYSQNDQWSKIRVMESTDGVHPKSEIITPIINHWITQTSDIFGDCSLPENNGDADPPGQVQIVGEAILHPDRILTEISKRHPALSIPLITQDGVQGIVDDIPSKHFYFRLVAVLERGRSAEIFLVFQSRKKKEYLGVFVKVDLFTSSYKELKWVRRPEFPELISHSSCIDAWCDKLVLDRQMRNRRVGPFSVNAELSGDYTSLCCANRSDPECVSAFDPEAWQGSVTKRSHANSSATNCISEAMPAKISLDSIYPDSHLLDNLTLVQRLLPARTLISRSAPVDLVYGDWQGE